MIKNNDKNERHPGIISASSDSHRSIKQKMMSDWIFIFCILVDIHDICRGKSDTVKPNVKSDAQYGRSLTQLFNSIK